MENLVRKMRNKNIYKKVQITLHNYKDESFQVIAIITNKTLNAESFILRNRSQDIQTGLLTAENKEIEEYSQLKYLG